MAEQMNCRRATAALITVVLLECACATTIGIADFATKSQNALAQGTTILRDIDESCIRRQTADLRLADFRTGAESLQEKCAEFADNQKGLLAASTVLSDYFGALSQLAATGSATIGADAQNIVASAGKMGRFSAPATGAIGELASLVARMAVDHYQHKQLAADLRKADVSISAVTAELAEIVQKDYLDHLLPVERQALTRRYETFAEDNPGPIVILLLQERWTNDLQRLAAKRSAALAYIKILKEVSGGHAVLAAHVDDKSIKSLSDLLKPYTDSLGALAAPMQMAY